MTAQTLERSSVEKGFSRGPLCIYKDRFLLVVEHYSLSNLTPCSTRVTTTTDIQFQPQHSSMINPHPHVSKDGIVWKHLLTGLAHQQQWSNYLTSLTSYSSQWAFRQIAKRIATSGQRNLAFATTNATTLAPTFPLKSHEPTSLTLSRVPATGALRNRAPASRAPRKVPLETTATTTIGSAEIVEERRHERRA